MRLINDEVLKNLNIKWKKDQLATLLPRKACNIQISAESKFQLDQVQGDVKLTKVVEIHPYQTVHVHGLSRFKGHDERVNIMTEPPSKIYSNSVVTVCSCNCLKP